MLSSSASRLVTVGRSGASVAVLRVSSSGRVRFVFSFPSPAAALAFSVIARRAAWSSLVSGVAVRGGVVVVRVWGRGRSASCF